MSDMKIPWPTSACFPSIIIIPRLAEPCCKIEEIKKRGEILNMIEVRRFQENVLREKR